jgi:hypothetical protein
VNLWDYLNRRAERNAIRPGLWERVLPADFRGWLAFGLFIQSSSLFGMIFLKSALQDSQGFMTLAAAVIVTGWIGGAAAFAYAAGKNSAERSEQVTSALRIMEANQPKGDGQVVDAANQVADAATSKADEIAGQTKD